MAFAFLSIVVAPHIPLGNIKIEQLASYVLLYATLSFGASIAGAGMALGAPSAEQRRRWSKLKAENQNYSAFQNLLFTFAWSAMVQIFLVVVAFLAIAFGTGRTLIPSCVCNLLDLFHNFWVFLAFLLWWYALFELTAVVRVFMQLAGSIAIENKHDVDRT